MLLDDRSGKSHRCALDPTGVGVFILAIDIDRFMPVQQFRELMRSYGDAIRKSRKTKGVSRIYLPGEIELEKEKKSLKDGIELNESLVKSLNSLLEKSRSDLRL